jgi:hypothetical protein
MPSHVIGSGVSPAFSRSLRTACVDEAYDIWPGGAYVLAAVVYPGQDAALSDRVRELWPSGQDHPPFCREDPKRRLLLAEAVARLGLTMIAAVETVGAAKSTAERLRESCVRRLSPALADVDAVLTESRGGRHDWLAAGLGRQAPLRTVSFARAREVPMLRVVDLAAGAVCHDVVRGNPVYVTALGAIRILDK